MNHAIITNLELVTVNCGGCGMIFAVPKHFEDKRREDGAGHSGARTRSVSGTR